MENLITAKNLNAGISAWSKQKNWDKDFHNGFYRELHDRQRFGLDEEWWNYIVDRLWDWRAIRPLSKQVIYECGLKKIELLREHLDLARCNKAMSRNLESSSWSDLRPLYVTAQSIKGVDSPVFGSKLCHFLLPDAYPVIDRAVVGWQTGTYDEYWTMCKRQWASCVDKQGLIETLRAEIRRQPEAEIVPYYPFVAKVTELCLIGSHSA